jgi:hypothetical protein
MQSAISVVCSKVGAVMFKITENTINRFTFAEILLMAAMNEIEAKRKAPATRTITKGLSRS